MLWRFFRKNSYGKSICVRLNCETLPYKRKNAQFCLLFMVNMLYIRHIIIDCPLKLPSFQKVALPLIKLPPPVLMSEKNTSLSSLQSIEEANISFFSSFGNQINFVHIVQLDRNDCKRIGCISGLCNILIIV